ncbi:hypothetical protein C8J27_102365 [Rhodobacter aestuarii]|uniref:Uncharacterized protein n=1 Tax=Rhodobacter aestuarii TaxID=453582 RepID=A0A1N7MSD5_9RHOB|nr:hypothetical protein [Rhodobacter aestuarii]PTV96566.1 hypothetical protein C8J27_102365 [Rhodobacter aestuarii]SIS89043.1 hypothetical protein SAMN05421580_106156 [Rhodobacter aestuarii]
MTPAAHLSTAAPHMAPEQAALDPFGLSDLISALCKGAAPGHWSSAGIEALIDRVEGRV